MCIKRGIFQGDSLSPLLITALVLLSVILREAVQSYRFPQGRKVNHLLYMDNFKVLELSLNGGNTVKAISTWAIAAVRYTAGIADWSADEMKPIDRKTRKLMNMNGALHPRADIDRLV